MKSLEIVNARIAHLEGKLKSLYESSNGHPISFNKQLADAYDESLDNCKQIKQDLEVLNIIWEKRISMEYLWFLYDYYKDFTNGINYMLEKINENQDETRKLTVEEMTKLKRWLEVNY